MWLCLHLSNTFLLGFGDLRWGTLFSLLLSPLYTRLRLERVSLPLTPPVFPILCHLIFLSKVEFALPSLLGLNWRMAAR